MTEKKVLIFAGTTEGRRLAEILKREKSIYSCVCVATEYGRDILELGHTKAENREIRAGRLSAEEMENLMGQGFDFVVDATHPYATEVTRNIRNAAANSGVEYLRLLRPKTKIENSDGDADGIHMVESTEKAVELLNGLTGNALLTVGSKELSAYIAVKNYKERLYARVLPMGSVVNQCEALGFSGKNLICMQGPFSEEINVAMLKQYNCRYLVTKDTGKEGGAYEKYKAAKQAGAELIVIGRGIEETGYTTEEIGERLGLSRMEGNQGEEIEKDYIRELADWFPMFVNIKDINILIVGAGKIASRRISTLLKFSCNLCIVASNIHDDIRKLVEEASDGRAGRRMIEKDFEASDMEGFDMVLAATNNSELNSYIGRLGKEKGILTNVADNKEICDFYFPGVAMGENLVIGMTAQGRNHNLAKKAGDAVRELVEENEKKWEEK